MQGVVMKKMPGALFAVGMVFVFAASANSEKYRGIEFPHGAASFADEVVSFSPGPGTEGEWAIPEHALGIPDYSGAGTAVSLGDQGELILKFTDNALITSGNDSEDLWFFQAGDAENMEISISTDGTDWIWVGDLLDKQTGVDIDAYTDSGVVLGQRYTYVRIVDLEPNTGHSPYAGVDIDAVGAISSTSPPTFSCWPDCIDSAEASVYGSPEGKRSKVINNLTFLFIPAGAIVFLRIWRRKT